MKPEDDFVVVEDDADSTSILGPLRASEAHADSSVVTGSLRALGVNRSGKLTQAALSKRQREIESGDKNAHHSLTELKGFDHPLKLGARRGLWLWILAIGCVVHVVLMFTIYSRWLHASVEIRPSVVFEENNAETAISEVDLRTFAETLISRMNRWSPWSLDTLKTLILPYFSPERQSDLERLFDLWQKSKAKEGIRSNSFITGSIALGVENKTVYSIVVYYEKIESLEKEGTRILSESLIRRAVVLDCVRVEATAENQTGIQVIGYTEYTEQQVKDQFNIDPWTGIREVTPVTP